LNYFTFTIGVDSIYIFEDVSEIINSCEVIFPCENNSTIQVHTT